MRRFVWERPYFTQHDTKGTQAKWNKTEKVGERDNACGVEGKSKVHEVALSGK